MHTFKWFLSILQKTKGQSHEFSILMQELKSSETEEYSAAILAFVNCLIASAETLEERVHIRNEMLGINLIAVN